MIKINFTEVLKLLGKPVGVLPAWHPLRKALAELKGWTTLQGDPTLQIPGVDHIQLYQWGSTSRVVGNSAEVRKFLAQNEDNFRRHGLQATVENDNVLVINVNQILCSWYNHLTPDGWSTVIQASMMSAFAELRGSRPSIVVGSFADNAADYFGESSGDPALNGYAFEAFDDHLVASLEDFHQGLKEKMEAQA